MLLEAWQNFESHYGDDESRSVVANMLPKRVLKRRRIQTSDGSDAVWEEYFDYIFPEDEASKPNLKLFAMAKAWKMGKDVVPGPSQTQTDTLTQQENTQDDMASALGETSQEMSSAEGETNTVEDDRDDSSESTSSDSDQD